MKLYSIYTENRNKPRLIKLINRFFDGFTILEAIGFWQGNAENSLIITIATKDKKGIFYLCEKIKEMNQQDCVMLVSNNKVIFI